MRPTDNLCSYMLLFALCVPAIAQQVTPTPPTQAGSPVGFIRVWHFAPSLNRKLSVSLAGAGQLTILARAITPFQMMSYRSVPAGRYKLTMRAAAADLTVKDTDPEVLRPTDLAVADKSFQTIILQDQIPKVICLNDVPSRTDIPPGSKRLRIFDFAAVQDASLKAAQRNEVVAAHLVPGISQHIFTGNPGVLTLVMSNKLTNGHYAEQNVEINFTSTDSVSAIVALDAYGRLALQAVEDARSE